MPDVSPVGRLNPRITVRDVPFPEGRAKRVRKAYFAGHLARHFGHFILEGLSRLHAFPRFADHTIIWTGPRKIADWQRAAFDLLIPGAEHLVLRSKIKCARLVIAEPGFEIGGDFARAHAAFLGRYVPGPMRAGRRVWLSRGRLDDVGGVEDEPWIESILAERGWDIVSPEKLPLLDQLETIGSAEIVAGVVGSAFHSVMLLRDCPASLRLLARGGGAGPNYHMIAARRGLDQRIVTVPMRRTGGQGSRMRYAIADEAARWEAIAAIDALLATGG